MRKIATSFHDFTLPDGPIDVDRIERFVDELLADVLVALGLRWSGSGACLERTFLLTVMPDTDFVVLELHTVDEELATEFTLVALERQGVEPRPARSHTPTIARLGWLVPYALTSGPGSARLRCLLDAPLRLTAPLGASDVIVAAGFAANARPFQLDLGPVAGISARDRELLRRLVQTMRNAGDPWFPHSLRLSQRDRERWDFAPHGARSSGSGDGREDPEGSGW